MPFKQQTYVATAFKHIKCADCNSPDPTWASINRGILLCWECCQVHRTLGRHLSDIASLQHSNWAPPRLQMLHNLVQNGANNIWEHELHNTKSTSNLPGKPGPHEKIRPAKENFIVAKYKDGKYCQKIDDVNIESLNNQLLLAVTQNSTETSLKLLVIGADANCHDSDLNSPLHLAAVHDQLLQYELLSIYGGNPSTINKDSDTPYDIARKRGHYQTANRILTLQYELTDRLIYFVNSKQPDHVNGQHIIIPEVERRGQNVVEAQNKLKMLDNQSFEELAADIYDEVDRREVEQVWKRSKSSCTLDVRFLPTNTAFSALRNQGRQKLGTLNAKDFVVLIAHVLEEGKRREQLTRPTTNVSYGSYDEEPSYCEVPSEYSDNEPVYDEGLPPEEGHCSPVYDQVPERDEYIDNKAIMTAKLESHQRLIAHLKEQNSQLHLRVSNLEQRNSFLETQNKEMGARVQGLLAQSRDYDLPHLQSGAKEAAGVRSSTLQRQTATRQPSYAGQHSSDSRASQPDSHYSNLPRDNDLKRGSVQQPRHQTLPAMETVSDKTQHITAAVTMLRDCIRNDDLPLLPDVYQKVLQASQGVASLFPENPQWQTVKLSLELLRRSAMELSQLSLSCCNGDRKLFIDSHVNLAKDIARATKSIMGYVQNASGK